MSVYHMQKKEREIKNRERWIDILRHSKYTTVAMCRNNEPYVVTLSCGFDEAENTLYFHSAQKGLKMEFLNDNPEVCATIIQDKGYKKGKCAHSYRSLVFWGKMTLVNDLEEKKRGLDILLNHLEEEPGRLKKRLLKDDKSYAGLGVLKLEISRITGKQGQ